MSEEKTKGQKLLNIGLGWLVLYEHSEHWLDFKAYEVIGTETASKLRLFKTSDDVTGPNFISSDLAEAVPSITGYVKWDGCCEIDLEDNHYCGALNVQQLTEVLLELHRLCLLLPAVDEECAGYG